MGMVRGNRSVVRGNGGVVRSEGGVSEGLGVWSRLNKKAVDMA